MLAISNSWPTWLIAIGLILNAILITLSLFKKQIGAVIPESVSNRFRLTSDQQDHEQDIEANLVDHDLQTKAAEQLRESQREARTWEVLRGKDTYLHGYLNGKVDELKGSQEATRQEVAGLREDIQAGFSSSREDQQAVLTAIGQTNNLLKEMTVILARRQGQ